MIDEASTTHFIIAGCVIVNPQRDSEEKMSSYTRHGAGFATAEKALPKSDMVHHQIGLRCTTPTADSRLRFLSTLWTLVLDYSKIFPKAYKHYEDGFPEKSLGWNLSDMEVVGT